MLVVLRVAKFVEMSTHAHMRLAVVVFTEMHTWMDTDCAS